MARRTPAGPPARSTYKGIRVTLTQTPGDRPAILTLAVKGETARWDEWNLLFPAIRVPHRPLSDYRDVLAVVCSAVETLLAAEVASH